MYPTWQHNQQTSSHRRSFSTRYNAIRGWLSEHCLSEFTALDFGAGGGYFTARLIEDFNATVTAVECDPHAQHNLATTGAHAIICDYLTPDDIRSLGRFDVTLALSVLHHCTDWWGTYQALLSSANIVFIECAHPLEYLPRAKAHDQSTAICASVGGEVLTHTPGYDSRYARSITVIDQRP